MTQATPSRWSPLGLALLCAHCSLGALAAILSAVLAAVGWTGGARVLAWVAPPVLILGAFVWLIRTPAEACPTHPSQ